MNLLNLGMNGLAAAQQRLQTAGHNINNAATEGYNRQSVLVQTAGATATGAGYIGRGVQAVTVQRAYDGFLFQQRVHAESTAAFLDAWGQEISRISGLFADDSTGIHPALQKFFDGLQAVASSPADPAARQELLGRAGSLVGQLNDANRHLNAQRDNVNAQLTTLVAQVNSHARRIADVNQQIVVAWASASAHEPNDLLDQRDQLLHELAQLVDVRIHEQDGQAVVSLGSGQVLLSGTAVYPLQARPAADDPRRTVIAYTVPGATGDNVNVDVDERRISGGVIGGLLAYRRDALDALQNDLGRLAAGLAMAVNEVHQQGHDLQGEEGGAFFTLRPPLALPAAGNRIAASPDDELGVAWHDVSALTGQDYHIEFDGHDYVATRLPDGQVTVLSGPEPVLDGLRFSLPARPPATGDAWRVPATRDAAGEIALAIQSPDRIAAAAAGRGGADGQNALALAGLQTGKILGNGTMSLNEAYSRLVNRAGVMMQENSTAIKAQDSLLRQVRAAQQAVSGVNLNEEYINLERHTEQFRAAARLIDVGTVLFDTLIGLRA